MIKEKENQGAAAPRTASNSVVQMRARFRLLNVGREKATREVECGRWDDLLREVGKHLRSGVVDVADDGTVLVGGWRPVGHVLPLDALAHEWLPLFVGDAAPAAPKEPQP